MSGRVEGNRTVGDMGSPETLIVRASFAREGEGPKGCGQGRRKRPEPGPRDGFYRSAVAAVADSRHLSECHLVSAAQWGQAPPPSGLPPSSRPELSLHPAAQSRAPGRADPRFHPVLRLSQVCGELGLSKHSG